MSATPEPRDHWWDWLTWPRRAISDTQRDMAALLRGAREINDRLKTLETTVSADRELLADIARGLTLLSTPVANLVASEAALRARVADLEGQAAADEAGDLDAAQAVKNAFDGIADKFREEPEVPDVEPLPAALVEEPTDEPPAAA